MAECKKMCIHIPAQDMDLIAWLEKKKKDMDRPSINNTLLAILKQVKKEEEK